MHARTTAAGFAAAALLMLTACGAGDDSKPAARSSATSGSAAPAPSGPLTAQRMVDELSRLHPLPSPSDNTGACNDVKGNVELCDQMVSTDHVDVYEFPSERGAAEWVESMDGVNSNDAVQAGRFMLIWQLEYEDEAAVAEMTKKAQELAASEN